MRILHLAQRGTSLHVLLIVVMTMLLAACGNTTPAEQIVGKWKFTKVITAGETKLADDLGVEWVYEFLEDGTMVFSAGDANNALQEVDKGKYVIQSGQLTLFTDEPFAGQPANQSLKSNIEFKGDTLFMTPNSNTTPSSGNGQSSGDVMVLERID